ncbi:MAG: single-stranded-DNA-specific exonuclease RecJ [Campylobacteraceae bacterium]|jgi:single-stranded-DNA-specific exonuclease|nr:single-stranded-DNA-specific exonuclease RecJ [Campylobacteraceae bacterium]
MNKLDKNAVRQILEKRFENDCHTKLSLIPSPFLFKDMEKAANRVKEAIKNREKIVVVGDYDVDGVISSVILSEFFDDIGVSHSVEIPNRFSDGYGLNINILDRVNANLIITVDNGISSVEAAEICKKNGVDLIVTDHHTPPETLPDAYAIINPKQIGCGFPNQEICGAQVAWYFIAAIKETCSLNYDLGKFLDLLAIAIVADMMELLDINRTMVKSGIKQLKSSKRPAFVAIKEAFNKEHLESDDVAYLISPLLNSTGRMEDAMFSFQFLKSKSKIEAKARLEEIVVLNNQRKLEEKNLFDLSLSIVNENDSVIVVWGEDWHEGVVGVVASKLVKKFKKPSVVFSINKDRAKGSARSISDVDILSLVSEQKELLLGYGGHFGAAGVLLEKDKLEQFKKQIIESMNNYAYDSKKIGGDILGELYPEAIDFELLEILDEFEPYGQKNPKPTFILKNMQIKVEKNIGRELKHKKLILQAQSSKIIEALYFNCDVDIKKDEVIDVVVSVSKNNFRGLITPQVVIKEVLQSIK